MEAEEPQQADQVLPRGLADLSEAQRAALRARQQREMTSQERRADGAFQGINALRRSYAMEFLAAQALGNVTFAVLLYLKFGDSSTRLHAHE